MEQLPLGLGCSVRIVAHRVAGSLRFLNCLLHLLDQLTDLFGGREPIIRRPYEFGLDALQDDDPMLDSLRFHG